jgi:glycerophosphoryl diester phosphodiesterase
MRRGFVVSSFLPEVLRVLYNLDLGIPLGLICETRAQLKQWRSLPVTHVIARHSLAQQPLVREIHEAKKKVFVWTVNSKVQAKKFVGWGVDGIISDDTRTLGREFGPACLRRRAGRDGGNR